MSDEQLIATPGVFGENGNFLLERELGRGGMGGVYMGRDKMLDRPVAVKVMLKEYGSDPEFVEKFKKEAQAVARLIHPNIAQVYSYGFSDGMPYIAMELVAGGSLDGLMKHHGKDIEVPRVMKICEQVAQALRCAADQGLVHGDVKPENILLDANGNAKLVDFGLAAMQKDTDEIWGTPYYIAPEKVKRQGVDYRADMYSLGGTIYHALTGVAPFEGDDATEVIRQRFQGPPKKPSELRPGLSPQIDNLVMTMLAVEPKDRYPSFEALLEEFKKVMTTGLSMTSSIPADVAAGTGGTKSGGKKLMLKKKGFKVKTPGVGGVDKPAASDDEVPPADGVEGDGTLPAKEDDEEEGGNIALKAVGVVAGVVAAIGLIVGGLVWYKIADKKAREEEERQQIQAGFVQANDSLQRTRAAAVKFADEFDTFTGEAINSCQKITDDLTEILRPKYSEKVIALLKPAPSAELVAAMASPSEQPKEEAPAPVAEAATNEVAEASAPAPAEEAPAEEEKVPTIVTDMADLWNRAYKCQAAGVKIRRDVNDLVKEIDTALQKKGDTLEELRQMEETANSMKDKFESIKAAKEVQDAQKDKGIIKSRGERGIKNTVESMRLEALDEARKKKAADEAEAEKQRKEEQAAAKAKAIEEETAKASEIFDKVVASRKLEQLDWKGAKDMINQLKSELETPEGLMTLNRQLKKVDCMEKAQNTMMRNLKDFVFTKGTKNAKYNIKGWKVKSADAKKGIVMVRPDGREAAPVTWRKFYKEYPNSFNELINKFVRKGLGNSDAKLRLSLKDWADSMFGIALTMKLICADNETALNFANELVAEAAKKWKTDWPLYKEVFPDVKWDEIEAGSDD